MKVQLNCFMELDRWSLTKKNRMLIKLFIYPKIDEKVNKNRKK